MINKSLKRFFPFHFQMLPIKQDLVLLSLCAYNFFGDFLSGKYVTKNHHLGDNINI